MKHTKRILCLLMMVVLIVTMMLPVTVSAASTKAISISKKTATLYVGKTLQLKVTGTSKTVKWSTSSKKIATVTQKGSVKAVKAGNATITAKVGKTSLTCKVTVKNPYINKKSVSIYVGKTYTLKLTGTSLKSTATSKKSVATVSKKGVVTAKKAGNSTVTLTGTNNKKYTCKVTVKNSTITPAKLELEQGKSYTLKLTGTSIKSVKTSNKAIATVTKTGKVTGVKLGSATITLYGKNGLKHTCKVTVIEPKILVSSITILPGNLSLYPGDSKQLTAQVLPENADDPSITWVSSNTSVATVENGLVKAIAPGSCTILAAAQDKSRKTALIDVTVNAILAETVTLNQTELSLLPGENTTLNAVVGPENASFKDVTWTSSDTNVVTVLNGQVTAVAGGTATITALATHGTINAVAECAVEVVSEGAIVDNLEDLLTAAANPLTKKIILSSQTTERIVIPEGSYENINLIINVPNGEVENNATWKEVHIQAISPDTYIENCQGNELYFEAPVGTITITSTAQVKIYIVDSPVISTGQEARSLTVIDNSNSSLVSGIELQSGINLTLTGDNSHAIDLTAQTGSEGSVIETTKKVDLKAEAKVQLVLEAGAEGSTVVINNEDSLPDISGLGIVPVTNTSTGDEMSVVAENTGSSDPGTISIQGTISVENAAIYLMPYDSTISVNNAVEKVVDLTPVASSSGGQYTITDCALGNYTLVILADGYLPVINTIVITSATSEGSTYQNNAITMIDVTEEENNGSISGHIIDSVTGNDVTFSVRLNLRSGFNNVSGDSLATMISYDGTYRFEDLAAGYYTVQAQSGGDEITIASNSINVVVVSAENIDSPITVTKTLAADQVQFVLHWYKEGVNEYVPSDLDSHLVGPVPDGTRFHTWYSDQDHYYANERYADLDVDDVTYEGPETTTIYHNVEGLYSFYVYDYTNRHDVNDIYMTYYSGAYVEIKSGSVLIDTIHIPTNQIGNLWHVVDYDSKTGKFTRVDTVSGWSDGSSTVGLTQDDINQMKLSDRISDLEYRMEYLFENTFKASLRDAISRAQNMKNKRVANGEITQEEVSNMLSELDMLSDQIYDFYISIDSDDDFSSSYDGNQITIYSAEENPGTYTITGRNDNGDNFTVVQTAQTDASTGLIGKALVTNTDTGMARQYEIYYRFDITRLFKISDVTGSGVFSYDYWIDRDDEVPYGYLDIYGLEEELPSDLSVTPSLQGVTWQIQKNDDQTILVMQKDGYSLNYRIHYNQSTGIFGLDVYSDSGIIRSNVSRDSGHGYVYLYGIEADLDNVDFDPYYSKTDMSVSWDQHPENCDGVCSLSFGDYTYEYYIYYYDITQTSSTIVLNQEMAISNTSGSYTYVSFTPQESGLYTVTSYATEGDPYAVLYDASGDRLQSNDDSGEDYNFMLSYNLIAENTYYYAFRGFGDTNTYPVILTKESI